MGSLCSLSVASVLTTHCMPARVPGLQKRRAGAAWRQSASCFAGERVQSNSARLGLGAIWSHRHEVFFSVRAAFDQGVDIGHHVLLQHKP